MAVVFPVAVEELETVVGEIVVELDGSTGVDGFVVELDGSTGVAGLVVAVDGTVVVVVVVVVVEVVFSVPISTITASGSSEPENRRFGVARHLNDDNYYDSIRYE